MRNGMTCQGCFHGTFGDRESRARGPRGPKLTVAQSYRAGGMKVHPGGFRGADSRAQPTVHKPLPVAVRLRDHLAGLWKTYHASPALCPRSVKLWGSLELGPYGRFTARSSTGKVLSQGKWKSATIADGSRAVFLNPDFGAYPTQLNSSTGQYLGGVITVDVPGGVCSWMLTLERPSGLRGALGMTDSTRNALAAGGFLLAAAGLGTLIWRSTYSKGATKHVRTQRRRHAKRYAY